MPYFPFKTLNSIERSLMSLTTILKKIDKVNQKQRQVEQRYNPTSKQCPRQSQLERQALEDQRIFGYSGTEILSLYKNKDRTQVQTRPCTANLQNYKQSVKCQQSSCPLSGLNRVQSAKRPIVNYRQQYNFLFKEDIFDQNVQKIEATMPFDFKQIKKENFILGRRLRNSESSITMKTMHQKALTLQRKSFLRSFDQNLEIMKMKKQKQKAVAKKSKNRMTYQQQVFKQTVKKNEVGEHEVFFKLTSASYEHPKSKISFNLKESSIKDMNCFLSKPQESNFVFTDPLRQPLAFEGFYEQLLQILPTRVTLTCIAVPCLLSVEIDLTVVNEQIVIDETRQKTDLKTLVNILLEEHDFLHLYFSTPNKQKLIFDIFVTNQKIVASKRVEFQISLLSYYLRRFLFLDKDSSIQAISQSAQLIIKSNIDIPDEFVDFLSTLAKKTIHFYDQLQCYYTLRLWNILSAGLKKIQAFKKEMGFGQKVVKLKQGTTRQIKKKICNWAYFYICLLTIIINLSTCGSSSSFAS